jgi:C-terminal peptidase prc
MKATTKITRNIVMAALTVLLFGTATMQSQTIASQHSSALVQATKDTTPASTDTTATKFDGHALYKATFEALRDMHITLVDAKVRATWVAEWEHKHDKDGKLDTEKGADEACLEMVQSLKQRFDYYFVPEVTAEEEHSEAPSYAGTGVAVTIGGVKAGTAKDSLPRISKEHPFTILTVIDGSPASKQDVRKKDRITAIDGKPVEGKTLDEAVAILRGENGVPVVISIERGATATPEKLNVTIVRADYVRPVVHFKDLGDGVSYIKLDNFMSQFSVKEMFDALNKAAQGKALILDLRGNHGGRLDYVDAMAEFFLEDGTILEQHERQDDDLVTLRLAVQPHFAIRTSTSSANPDSTDIKPEDRMRDLLPKDMPVVVLVDDDSYSAAEILSGALQQTHRATVVGVPTGGKGVGQAVRKLPFGRSMHVTSFEFLPGGAAMDWVGVIPDIEVKQAANFDEDDASTDAQLKAALSQAKSMLNANAQLEKKRAELRKKNEDAFLKEREGK